MGFSERVLFSFVSCVYRERPSDWASAAVSASVQPAEGSLINTLSPYKLFMPLTLTSDLCGAKRTRGVPTGINGELQEFASVLLDSRPRY